MKEILISWSGDIELFKSEFPKIQVVIIPEMLDGCYMMIYDSPSEIVGDDFNDELTWLDGNGTLEVIGKWKDDGDKKIDDDINNNFTVTKYKKYLLDIWDEDRQKFVKAPEDKPVNKIYGWGDRNLI